MIQVRFFFGKEQNLIQVRSMSAKTKSSFNERKFTLVEVRIFFFFSLIRYI